jgi:hypothetical protein
LLVAVLSRYKVAFAVIGSSSWLIDVTDGYVVSIGAYSAFTVSCYYSFRVQRYVRCMIHVRYEYSLSQAVLDERRSGCAPYIMYGYRA